MAKWFLVFLILNPLYAEQLSLNQHEEGWYWHKDPKIILKKKEKIASPIKKESADPDKIWKLIGKEVQRAHAQAILNPTLANISRARHMQRLVVAQANLFSEKWMLDLLINPNQDESLINPNSSAARDIYNQNKSREKERIIAQIALTSGLIYFYQAGEPFSERMAEVVREFATAYQMSVIPIAMTDAFSPLLPNSKMDSGEANQLGVKHIPAVFALNPISKKTMPVAYGLISQSELKEHILMATQAFQWSDYHAQ